MSETADANAPKSSDGTNQGSSPENPASANTTFGTRGSGRLSRGKPPKAVAASAEPAPPPVGDYTPKSVSVIQPPREFKSPFGQAEEAAVGEPAQEDVVQEASSTEELAVPEVSQSVPAPARQEEESPEEPSRGSLEILPPAEQPRARFQSWERDESRPGRPADRPRQPRRSEGGRQEPRRHQKRERERPPRPETAERQPAENNGKSSKGFFGWLKSLFTGKPAQQPARPSERPKREEDGGDGRRRRSRRGRGPRREGDGPHSSRSSEGQQRQGGGGGRRRRRRRGPRDFPDRRDGPDSPN